jgi:hypothetical protein
MKTYQMSLISAGSISLDITFKQTELATLSFVLKETNRKTWSKMQDKGKMRLGFYFSHEHVSIRIT